jgi:hypothetical protein
VDAAPGETLAQALIEHDRNEKRAKPNARPARHQIRGDVAVVEDQGTIVTRAHAQKRADLVGAVAIEFTPRRSGYSVSLSDSEPDVYGSVMLPIARPSDSSEVVLPFPFRFFGNTYTTAWVNGAGNVTFGSADADPFDPHAHRCLTGW